MRRILALLLPLLLLLSACSGATTDPSSSDSASTPPANAEALASVKVEDHGAGKPPTVTFDKPLAIKAESIRVVTKGTGAEIKAGQAVTLRAIGLNAEDGTAEGNNFADPAGERMLFDDTFKSQNPVVYNTFVGAKIGSYVAYAYPGTPAVAGSSAAPSQPAKPTVLSVFFIESASDIVKPLTKPEGETLTPPAGLPTVKENDKGVPAITIGDAKAPTELIAQDLIKGKGVDVKSGDTIVVNYAGATFSDGKVFDESYSKGQTFTTPIGVGKVIPGWDKGLVGKTVGSRVLLVIPKDLAYASANASNGQPIGDLVFVVDILGVE
ncbi:FKBP-type peptidyl-prolyl cis-trans isomerase [Arthrobacter alpinus]|uniref:FKBP-type peptidyl-prolyl cis-trans isomerase n=1 Tax=Arthrobacter alpinus TaxID=656366 RepID=UPI001645F573|nr:FKBP-type peptidyl-prolyl cis-trans isomerase [Arthrobacter alpinus]